jgi:signal transduction histidine kinase
LLSRSTRLRWWLVVAALVAAAFAIDLSLFPTVSLPVLYVPAVLVAGRFLRFRELIAVAAVCVLLNGVDLFRGEIASIGWVTEFMMFIILSYVAMNASYAREVVQAERRRMAEAISIVERVRQPLTVILGNSQLLERDGAEPGRVRRTAEAIERAALDLRELLNQILAEAASSPRE